MQPQRSSDNHESVAPYLTCTGYRVLVWQRPAEGIEWPMLVAYTHDRGGIGLSAVNMERLQMMPQADAQLFDQLLGAAMRHVMTIPFGQGARGLQELAKLDGAVERGAYLTWLPIKECRENLQAFFDGTQARLLGIQISESVDVRSVEGSV